MELLKNVDLKNHNTFMLPCVAKNFCIIKNTDDIIEMINSEAYKMNQKKYILGQGANTIFIKDFDGLIIKNEIMGVNILNSNDDILIKVGAGEIWYDFVSKCAQNNFVGMENLAYIPSSIGASVVQNIGAYGAEAKDIIYEVEGVDLNTGKTKIFKNNECNFAYRDSIFKHELKDNFLVTYVTYKLKKYSENYDFNCEYAGINEKIAEMGLDPKKITPSEFVQIITEIRKSKLPDWHEIGTAGSFFKNPVISAQQWADLQQSFPELKGFEVENGIKLSAGQLIDLCGFKGKDNGKVGTYKSHALILINMGSAIGLDVVQFSNEIKETVNKKFGVILEPEAIFVE